MQVLRTPEERFENLFEWDYQPLYREIPTPDGEPLRMHYVDEGPKGNPPVLLLHGEPSWAYLYRKMIPLIAAEGLRPLAPDLIGFGRSDKLADRNDYTYARHVAWVTAFVQQLDLSDITLVCQDWGGLIGLRILAEHPERFARAVAANTFLPTGDQPLGDAFFAWRDYSQQVPEFPIGDVVERGCVTKLTPEEKAAYDAPFPDESYKEGARQFPALVPATPDDPAAAANRRAWEVLFKLDVPFLTAFGDSDPITRGADALLQSLIRGAGHFIQQDKGEELAEVVIDFVRKTS